ncbi:MAG: hypothetical protein JW874_08740 [Spirochaetales bacterium]|nr:hypothetical protein [Spirochaetales bacterium]
MKKILVIAGLCLIAATGSGTAVEPAEMLQNEFILTTERIVVFKDGYCLFAKRLSAMTDEKGRIIIDEVPDEAVLGSFWAIPENGKLVSMTAEENVITGPVSGARMCMNYLEMLKSNIGRNCTVTTQDDKSFSGIIAEVLAREYFQPRYDEDPYLYYDGDDYSAENEIVYSSLLSGELFVLENRDAKQVISVSDIRRIEIEKAVYKREWHFNEKKKQKRLLLQFDKSGIRQDVLLFYFTPGFRWIPSYRIDIDDETGKAGIFLQAEIVNSLVDVENTQIELVVGTPNIKFRDIKSPMTLEKMVAAALEQANFEANRERTNMLSNAIFSQMLPEQSYERGEVRDDPGDGTWLPADSVQDFYFYSLDNVSLKKGAAMAVPLFTTEVSFKDVYVLDLKVVHNSNSYYAQTGKTARNEIWHYLELENNSKWPWTTGPAMIMQDYLPVGQDLLKYTAMGNKVRIPVSVATDIHASCEIEETGRKENAIKLDRDYYSRIDKEFAIKVRNYRNDKVDLEVRLEIGGKVEKAGNGGSIVIDSFYSEDWQNYYSMQLNNHSSVLWKTRLSAANTFDTKCSFFYYINN